MKPWIDPGAELALPEGIRACATTREGGVSAAPFDSLNLAIGEGQQGDALDRVRENRRRLMAALGVDGIAFLRQVHGRTVARIDAPPAPEVPPPEADAAVTSLPGVAVAVLTADCLPVLFAAEDGARVGAAHAGWRGLAAGVLEATLEALERPAGQITAWLGPAIGPDAFEVGPEVREAFLEVRGTRASVDRVRDAFTPGRGDRWQADLWALARLRLEAAGVERIGGGGRCVHREAARFFSFRRDRGRTGRQASLIWINPRRRS
ncbi:MAG: peptidoglycan editing factor PgeF [Pseudomonadales bacterium]|nr:peptidoglycan editing factor PgeF [Pseudomonadales bacterium]